MTRATRAETQATERRRRNSLDAMQDLKMQVPQSVREKYPEHVFRWLNDSGNRIHHKTTYDDWDKVDGVSPIPVGVDKQGKPIEAHLFRKLRSFHEQDMREADQARRLQQQQLMRQASSDPQDNRPPEVSYVPEGNSISEGYSP